MKNMLSYPARTSSPPGSPRHVFRLAGMAVLNCNAGGDNIGTVETVCPGTQIPHCTCKNTIVDCECRDAFEPDAFKRDRGL